MTLVVKGMDELRAGLEGLAKDIYDLPAFVGIADRMAALARTYAPRRTGALATSIRPTATPNRATIVATVPYAAIINYGSRVRNIRPAKFMQRVDAAMAHEASQTLDRAVSKAIDKRGL